MRRVQLPPRDGWERRVAASGLVYHSGSDGTPYWREGACYELSLAEIETIEAATAELHARCLDALALRKGEAVLHVGAGAGYYTAILAHLVGAGGRVHARIWSTPYYTVESSTSPRSGVVQPTTVHSSSPTCTPQRAGNPGFTVTVTRRLLLDGVEQETTSDTWRYKPQNAVVCDPATP